MQRWETNKQKPRQTIFGRELVTHDNMNGIMSFFSVCSMFSTGLATYQAPAWGLQIKLASFGVGN